ncbi:MAG: hypothetical protein REI11_00175, partial [Patulibacter sp.]|nr:hypothetical protein [Patulibacter sp.]
MDDSPAGEPSTAEAIDRTDGAGTASDGHGAAGPTAAAGTSGDAGPAGRDASLAERLLSAGATDEVRREALEDVLRSRGEATVATLVSTPRDIDRGSLLVATADDRPF